MMYEFCATRLPWGNAFVVGRNGLYGECSMMKKSVFAAAVVALCSVSAAEAASVNYTQYLKTDDTVLVDGDSSVESQTTSSLNWVGGGQSDAASGASLNLSDTSGFLNATGNLLARWELNDYDVFSLDLTGGDILTGLDADESVIKTKFRLVDFGNGIGDRIDFRLYYADGSQVSALADIDGRFFGNSDGGLSDLGGGLFQMKISSDATGASAEFASIAGGPLLGRIEAINFHSQGSRTGDLVGVQVARVVQTPTPVPAPAAGILLLSGISGLALFRRRNRA